MREFQNEIERLMALKKSRITPEDLNPKIRSAANIEVDDVVVPSFQEFMKIQNESELSYIQTLVRKGGTIREACRSFLNASPSTISTRIKILEKNLTNFELKNEPRGDIL